MRFRYRTLVIALSSLGLLASCGRRFHNSAHLASTTSGTAPLPKYTGGVQGNAAYSHDGKLRWAVGVQNVQVIRSAPSNPSLTDGKDTIYRHHQFIAYWGGYFWVMHDGGGSRLAWSRNGLDWSPADSSESFPNSSVHRMAFYVASNGHFLASHWLGTRTGDPGSRLVREVYGPNSYGPVYLIKANATGPYPNKTYPHYSTSTDAAFKAACDELYNNRLYREQWQEEDYKDSTFYEIGGGTTQMKAFSWYLLPDGRAVGTWKGVQHAGSENSSWGPGGVSAPVKVTSFGYHLSAKTFGARTEDGRYAMVGCTPGGDLGRRWPLSVTTSTDGTNFNTPHLVIAGDIPQERYEQASDDKNAGPQYVRGITPGNGNPPGSDLWLTYSMNKEDIWVAQVPVPIQGKVTSDVRESFQSHSVGKLVNGWNTYSPAWAPVGIADEAGNRFLRLEDRDPVDYASVTRVFPEYETARLSFDVRPSRIASSEAPLEVDVVGYNGDRAVTLAFDPASGQITSYDGATKKTVSSYAASSWVKIGIRVFGASRRYSLSVNDQWVLSNVAFRESTPTVERIVFRTGAFRLRDFTRRPVQDGLSDRIPNADVPLETSRYDIDNVELVNGASVPPSGWTAINSPTSAGNNFGWNAAGSNYGGVFARTSQPKYYANVNLGGTFKRTDTFSFSGDVILSNQDFNGTFFLGYVDKNDVSLPSTLVGIAFDEPSGSATGPFRARGVIRAGSTSPANVDSPVVFLDQNKTYSISATWKGNSDGSGTLSGTIGGTPFSVSQGATSESLNAFGIGVGFAGGDSSTANTGGCYFSNLKYSLYGGGTGN